MGNEFTSSKFEKYFDGVKPTKPREDRRLRDDYQITLKIGEGCFGGVYQANHRKSNKKVAVKKIVQKNIRKPERFRNEVWTLIQMDHPNIIKFFDYYKDEKYYFLITDLMEGGELLDKFYKKATCSEQDCIHIVKQMLAGVAFMHSIGIVHRDLKPANFLWDRRGPIQQCTLKLCDFGFSRKMSNTMRSIVGTPYYVAPEVIRRTVGYGEKCDVWSIGAITYFILCGKHPYDAGNLPALMKKICNDDLTFHHKIWRKLSHKVKDFIRCTMQKNPRTRIEIRAAADHAWLKQASLQTKSHQSPLMDNTMAENIIANIQHHHKKTTFRKLALKSIIHYATDEYKFGQLMTLFQKFDEENCGAVSYANFLSVLTECGIDIDVAHETFILLQTDNKSYIFYTEFLTSVVDRQLRSELYQDEKAMRMTFDFLADNESDYLSKSQIKRFLKRAAKHYSDTISHEVDDMTQSAIDFDYFQTLMKRDSDRARKSSTSRKSHSEVVRKKTTSRVRKTSIASAKKLINNL